LKLGFWQWVGLIFTLAVIAFCVVFKLMGFDE
jgi:hypothetical protein